MMPTDLNTLDEDFYYPIYYAPGAQRKAYMAGLTTHKRPSEMTERERRRVLKAEAAYRNAMKERER